jgi:hypothetical protein
MKDQILYFSSSAVCAGAKTVWYAFTTPSSIRKSVERSSSYRSHKNALMKIAEERNQRESAKNYIDIGDLVGFLGGLSGIVLYANEAVQNPNMISAWLVANGLSAGYEVARAVDKRRSKLRKK